MRLFLVFILLGFPFLEIWLLFKLFSQYGWLFFAYLVLVGVLGYRLLQDEKLMMLGRMAQTLTSGQTPAKAMFASFKNIIAGILLMIPGVVTDAIAVVLLLIPVEKLSASSAPYQQRGAANDDVIEGEFRRED